MAEPENHTLALLREIREALREFQSDVKGQFSTLGDRFDKLEQRPNNVRQAAIGEGILARYAVADVDERLEDIERRLEVVEQSR